MANCFSFFHFFGICHVNGRLRDVTRNIWTLTLELEGRLKWSIIGLPKVSIKCLYIGPLKLLISGIDNCENEFLYIGVPKVSITVRMSFKGQSKSNQRVIYLNEHVSRLMTLIDFCLLSIAPTFRQWLSSFVYWIGLRYGRFATNDGYTTKNLY